MPKIESFEKYNDRYDEWFEKNHGIYHTELEAIKAEKQGIRVYCHEAEDLPFSDSEFDFVLMVTTICFVDDISKSFFVLLLMLVRCNFNH